MFSRVFNYINIFSPRENNHSTYICVYILHAFRNAHVYLIFISPKNRTLTLEATMDLYLSYLPGVQFSGSITPCWPLRPVPSDVDRGGGRWKPRESAPRDPLCNLAAGAGGGRKLVSDRYRPLRPWIYFFSPLSAAPFFAGTGNRWDQKEVNKWIKELEDWKESS